MHRFVQVTLRTTAVDAAREFYATVLGERDLEVFPLHEQALARGARPHWLGLLEVDDVDAGAAAFTARGATLLGPKWQRADGLEAAVLREPGGAVVALARSPTTRELRPAIAWYVLNTVDVERARTNHRELFGWHFDPPVERGELGRFHPFAFERGGPSVGVMSDISTRPGVHPHWLFFFAVDSLESASEAARRAGALLVATVELPDGERVVVLDDPQGAAFGLRARRDGDPVAPR